MKILFVIPELLSPPFNYKNFFHQWLLKKLAIPISSTIPTLATLTPKSYSIDVAEGLLCKKEYDKGYDLVGITCITRYARSAYEIADEFRKRGVTVVLGGWHPSALPHEAKQHADSVVIGEAEETWPQLLRDFENGKLKPFYTIQRPVDTKLIPPPRTDIFPKKTIAVHATRGCPPVCDFCAITGMKFRHLYRMRPIKEVIKEIQSVPDKFFRFYDDSLTINTSYTKELFKQMKDLNKKFGTQGNVNVLCKDDELLKLASEAGCFIWFVGFESMCQKSIDSVGKNTNKVENYLSVVKKVHDYGMTIVGAFIFGFDHDTLDIFEKTDDFVRKSEIDIPYYLVLTPYPGTPLFERMDKDGRILTKDWSRYTYDDVVFQPKHMTPNELLSNTRKMREKWYSASYSIARILRSMKFGYYPFSYVMLHNLHLKFLYK